jgi:hypothetical protein
MKIAELITKIVRSSGATGKDNTYYRHYSANHAKSMATNTITKPSAALSGVHGTFPGNNTTHVEAGDRDSSIEMELQGRVSQSGIVRTIETTVATSPVQMHDYHHSYSRTSSTTGLAI